MAENTAQNQQATNDKDAAKRKQAMTQVVTELEKSAGDQRVTTSSKIRALNAKGYTRSEIAKFLNKRYQHVRNVLVTPIQKSA